MKTLHEWTDEYKGSLGILRNLYKEEAETSNSQRYHDLGILIKNQHNRIKALREGFYNSIQNETGLPAYMFKELL